ncbi:MAG: glycine betaine ABC transporter substrate-binding protein [Armatimonadota bacterium]|nr:glycine betaine ABC transporter substrate-binding protein [Armatimonadota bacterium]MDR7421528.1 glycine betaine ABC transporter substrate-binding protein [Armatimonadota bacterium]MDR7456771.1 glycine betaine ABC transporter substrate-binding protein [Armatimonadota bacterium]MDR7497015.1 glycine betaine ABC transporter substrate-binding protein [Armatimonadota bacterium]MDR7510503.1 glycine betaine ABC transporter substrate-binding protein [Armatimonadota bacterium]
MRQIARTVVLLVLVAAVAAACGQRGGGAPVTVKIGSKDFTEEFILAEMYALLLEDAGFRVERKFNLGGTPVAHEALVKGDIDLYPEYTSTGLLTVLRESPLADPQAVLEAVRRGYREKFNLEWLEPAQFNNTQALATTPEVSTRYGIRTYSDLAAKAGELRLGGPAEFAEREDGIKGLQRAYGGFVFKEFRQLGTGSLRYEALKNGQVDVVVAFGTDGQISGLGLVLLEDDKRFYPAYQAAPVVRAGLAQQNPKIAETLNKLAPLLTEEVMAGLNWKVDGPEKQEFAAVAKAFLQEKGLIRR